MSNDEHQADGMPGGERSTDDDDAIAPPDVAPRGERFVSRPGDSVFVNCGEGSLGRQWALPDRWRQVREADGR